MGRRSLYHCCFSFINIGCVDYIFWLGFSCLAFSIFYFCPLRSDSYHKVWTLKCPRLETIHFPFIIIVIIIIKRKRNIFLALGYWMFMCFRTWNTYPWCLWMNILNAISFIANCNNELVLTRRSIRFLSWNFVSRSVGRALFPSTAGKSRPVIRKYFLATSWSFPSLCMQCLICS